ncbi:unnamed protein product [Porites evermanni]|uniref:Gag-pol polyprotein n=1 Tax=Porites evermanni TaxID=104178 RepID=A0ABN8LLV9_9CNID|nr:unnamed protein product [Porites evermanni]
MRDFVVLRMNSDRFQKDCFKVGNVFTFKDVRDMAKSEESADKQLQLMNTQVYSINVPKGYQRQGNQRPTTYTGSSRPKARKKSGWGPHPREQCPAENATCHYFQKVGNLAKVCLSTQKKRNVHEIEATRAGPSESVPDSSQSSCDDMFLAPISATPLTSN